MRPFAVLGALCYLAASSVAPAQVSVSAQTERTDYLLYERMDLLVTVTNVGGTDLTLDNNEGHPWLSFLVSKHNKLPVRQERESSFRPVDLKVGKSKTFRVNLTPLFLFREPGDYQAAAVVDLPGEGQIISDSVPFNVVNGRQVWSQVRPVDGAQRTYSLLRFSPKPDRTDLYLRVEAPDDNIVYANLSLGEIVAYIDPDVFFDPQGNIHVLQPIAMGTYLYSRADPDGKILHQGIFKTYQMIPPRLARLDDGSVIVVGGLEDNPNALRERLSDGQKTAQVQPERQPDQPGQPGVSPAAAGLDTGPTPASGSAAAPNLLTEPGSSAAQAPVPDIGSPPAPNAPAGSTP